MNKIYALILSLVFSILLINVNIAYMARVESNLHDLKLLNNLLLKPDFEVDYEPDELRISIIPEPGTGIEDLERIKLMLEKRQSDIKMESIEINEPSRTGGPGEITLVIDANSPFGVDEAESPLKELLHGLKKLEVSSRYSYEIKGEKQSNANVIDKKRLAENFISEYNIEKVNIIRNEDYLSITGFTPKFKEYIELETRKVNLQLVFKTDSGSKEDKGDTVEFIIGFPIIDGEF